MIPVYINCRDRVADLRHLVEWLENAGQERIILLDNASTWEPLRCYLRASPHEVRWLDENAGSKSLWNLDLVPDEPFVFTDPDVLPLDECPQDAISYLLELLERQDASHVQKAALGLHLDDVPADLECLPWEQTLVAPNRLIAPGVYDSLVDTTFAVYRASAPFNLYGLRTGHPYQARHMSWYVQDLDPENRHYLENAISGPLGSSWAEQGVS